MRQLFACFVLCVCALVSARASIAAEFIDSEASVAQVLQVLDQRLAVMPDVAAYKWSKRAAVSDPPREQAVIQNAVERAAPLGLEAEGLRRVFELQIRLAREVQGALHEQWKQTGFDPSRPIPSLENDIRPKLDRITPELIQSLYLAASELRRDDFVSAYANLAAQKLVAQGWSEASRRESLEALHAVRLQSVPALERIQASKVLRIGVTGDYAPFALLNGNTLSGSDIEMAQSLARKLQVRPVFVRTSWARLIDDLNQYNFDIAMGGVSVTPARQAVAAFSLPYTSGGKTLIARCKDAQKYKSLQAVNRRGVRVIVNPGGTNEQFAREKLTHASVQVFQDNRAIFDEIRAGRADVMITDDVEVELQTHRHADLCRPDAGTYTHSDKAILLPRDAKLATAVNEWLAPEVQSGNPARLIEQFLQTPP